MTLDCLSRCISYITVRLSCTLVGHTYLSRITDFYEIRLIIISGNAQNRVNHTVDMRMRRNYVKHLHLCIYYVGEAVETAESGRCVYPRAELDIHVVRRREHLATDTTEERHVCPGARAICSIHA